MVKLFVVIVLVPVLIRRVRLLLYFLVLLFPLLPPASNLTHPERHSNNVTRAS